MLAIKHEDWCTSDRETVFWLQLEIIFVAFITICKITSQFVNSELIKNAVWSLLLIYKLKVILVKFFRRGLPIRFIYWFLVDHNSRIKIETKFSIIITFDDSSCKFCLEEWVLTLQCLMRNKIGKLVSVGSKHSHLFYVEDVYIQCRAYIMIRRYFRSSSSPEN